MNKTNHVFMFLSLDLVSQNLYNCCFLYYFVYFYYQSLPDPVGTGYYFSARAQLCS